MKRIAVFLVVVIGLIGIYTYTFAGYGPDDLTVLSVGSYTRQREAKLPGGWWMYSFKVNVASTGKLPLGGVCGTVRGTSSSVKVIDPEVCFPEIPAGGSATSKGTFTIWTSKRLSGPPTNLSWIYSSLKVTADPFSLAMQQGAPYNALSYYVTLSISAPKKYYVLFHQTVPKGITVTEQSLLTRQMSQSGTWEVTEFVSAPAAMTGEITARAWILNTLQHTEVAIPLSVTTTPPPPQLSILRSSPDALRATMETPVRFTIAISGFPLPQNLSLEQQTGDTWQSITTLTDSGTNGDIQAGDALYGGMATFAASAGTLVFRAVSPTGEVSASYALTVTPFPTGPAPTDPTKIISTASGQKVVGNRLLVRFQPGTSPDTISAIISTISGSVVGFLGTINYYHVEIPSTSEANLSVALTTLMASPSVLAAQPDFVGEGSMVPNDPGYAQLPQSNPPQIDWLTSDPGYWGMRVVKAENAWDINPGNGVKVAVIDYGVDPTHRDLLKDRTNLSLGSRVIPCIIKADASGNNTLKCPTALPPPLLSCTIIVNGTFYYLNCPPQTETYLGMTGSDFLNLMKEDAGHGTQVAGIIGATGNNGEGIAGMVWNSDILGIKACTDGVGCSTSAVAYAVTQARLQDARVINLSLRTTKETYNNGNCDPVKLNDQQKVDEDALRNTIQNASLDAVIVAAADNYVDSAEEATQNVCKAYPAAYPGAIAVGAVTQGLTMKSNSRRGGDWVHLAAPGDSIRTLLPSYTGGTTTPNGKDTSIAAPHVAGAAALLWAQALNLSASSIRTRLLLTAETMSSLNNNVYQNKFLNVYNGLALPKATATVTLTPGSLTQTYDGTPKSVTATTDPPGIPHTITYNGSTTVPTNAGTYTVVATINNNPYYQGSVSGIFVIEAALTPPSDLRIVPISGSSVRLFWTAGTGLDGYIIYYGNALGPPYDWNAAIGNSTSATITGLSQGTTYWFAVAGVYNGSDETALSPAVSIAGMPAFGTLDANFGTGGFVVSNGVVGVNSYDEGYSIAVDPLGRIFVTGVSVLGGVTYDASTADMVIWCYDSNGDPCSATTGTAFGTNGIVVYNGPANNGDFGYSITVNPSTGRILLTGGSYNTESANDMVIWCYESNGEPCLDFGTNGIVVYNGPANGEDQGHSISVNPSTGRILLTGGSDNLFAYRDMVIWCYESNGEPCLDFGNNGIVVYESPGLDFGHSITTNPSTGRILVTGFRNDLESNDMVIWCYESNGEPCLDFGNNGILVSGSPWYYDEGLSITIGPSGRILVSGYSNNWESADSKSDMVIWCYQYNGEPCLDFGNNGIVVYNGPDNTVDRGNSITIDLSGRIIVTGWSPHVSSSYDMVIWCYESNGEPCLDFGTNGIVVYNGPDNTIDRGNSITIDLSGRIIVTGYSYNSALNSDMVIWRYLP